MLALPQEYVGSICEIKSMTNDLLAVGRIIKIDQEALELTSRDDGRMPLLQYRMPVKLYVQNSRLDTRVLAGITYLSTDNFLRVEDVRPLQNFERRGAFRVNLKVPGHLTLLFTGDARGDYEKRYEAAEPEVQQAMRERLEMEVTVLDASLTGVRLRTPSPLSTSARYVLDFTPHKTPMSFAIVVQRIIQAPGGETQYGCSFLDYDERQLDALWRELFQLQRIEKNRRRNTAAQAE